MSGALLVRGLCKQYGRVAALADLDLAVAPGEIVGLLGPNGAGKTTAIEAIAGLVAPDAGTILVGGIDAAADPRRARRRVGVVLQATGLPDRITPREALAFFARLHDTPPDPEPSLARVGLAGKADAAYVTLSGGQRQRLALALAFVGDPGLVLLDEPTAGLDPTIRRELQEHVRARRDAGCAMLLATHDMAEAERLCDRLVILDRGRVIATGSPAELVAEAAEGLRLTLRTARAPASGWPATLPGANVAEVRGPETVLRVDDLNLALSSILALLARERIALEAVASGQPTLEDLIVDLARRGGSA